MKGLLRNNFYATISNVKVFLAVMLVLGAFVMAAGEKRTLPITGYLLLGIVGFSLNSIASLRKESVAKWNKYKLTTPVKRSVIVKSYFISLLMWVLVGMVFVGGGVALFITLQGYPFSRTTDVFMLFVAGIAVSLFTGAIFFPLFYLGGAERSEIFIGISLLCAIGIVQGLSVYINYLFPAPMDTIQVILGGVIILVCAVLAFALSYPLTVCLYGRKEY